MTPYYPPDSDLRDGTCSECGTPCREVVWDDLGRWVKGSPCCNKPVVSEDEYARMHPTEDVSL